MANSFFSESSPSLDKIVREATTFDAMKAALHKAQGMVSEEETIVNSGYRPAPVESVVPPPVAQHAVPHGSSHTHERVIYPKGNDRYILTGFSDEELNQKEAAIKAALGVQ